jgi:hypothetical protein
MSAETLVMLALGSIVFSCLIGSLLMTRTESFFPAVLPGNLTHPASSGVDVLRVGSAALITLRGELYTTEARRVVRKCGAMIDDGVAHLVVEFKDGLELTDPVLQLLLCLSELERVRGGRICVVTGDQATLDRLEHAGIPCLTAPPPEASALGA